MPSLPQKAARGTLNFHVRAAIAWNVVWFAHANRLPDADVICEGTVDDLLIEAGRASDDSDVMNAWIAM
jgi:hypothetical protein